jgi:RimJ/RimL family protein N-acetyltransferase
LAPIVVVHYSRGYYKRHTLAYLWEVIEESGDWDKIFWEERDEETTPISTKGDLVEWITYMNNPVNPTVLLIGTVNNEVAALSWFNDIKKDSAHGNIWIRPAYRGPYSREFVRKCMNYVFNVYGWEIVYGATPHAISQNLMLKSHCGWKKQAKIRNVYWFTCEKKDYFNGKIGS